MSMVYSESAGRFLDTDSMEAVELSNGTILATDDDEGLLRAYHNDQLSRDEMFVLGFTDEDLEEDE